MRREASETTLFLLAKIKLNNYINSMKQIFCHFLIILLALTSSAQAQSFSFIRDAELEHTLRQMTNPILKQAGLVPENVNLFIIGSDDINAFVAGGQNIFIFTGLIKAMTEPDMLMAVLAHETGHIAGGHLARGTEKLKNAQFGSILGFVLGVAAAAAGAPDAGAAVLSGSNHLVGRSFLAFTRSNEQAADQAALGYLDALNISAEGMVETFEVLSRNQRSALRKIDQYAITHPLSSTRITHAENHLARSTIPKGQYPKEMTEPYARLVAKLYSFTEPAPKTFVKYPASDTSIAARMARAVALHKQANTQQALETMESVVAERPKDGFLHELHGQLLFESGHIDKAREAYERANKLRSNQPLIMTALSEVYLATKDKTHNRQAINLLERAISKDRNNASSFRLLATAYGRKGELGLSHLALAEQAALRGDAGEIDHNVRLALTALPEASPGRLRAEDLKRVAQEIRNNE